MTDEYCNLNLPVDYDLHWFIAYATLAFVGLFYALLGKRTLIILKNKKILFRLSLVACNNVCNIL
jgi:hypothetical protein